MAAAKAGGGDSTTAIIGLSILAGMAVGYATCKVVEAVRKDGIKKVLARDVTGLLIVKR
jgi:hypothetical protein